MAEEEPDQYLIHSDVFSSTNEEENLDGFRQNSIRFIVPLLENDGKINVDDDGDLDVSRPERIDIILGIFFFT